MTFSSAGAEKLRTKYSIAADRICVAHPGVNVARFHPSRTEAPPPPPEDGLVLLFAGHNFRLKGLTTAITATARCRRNGINASLAVAGGGPTSRYRRLAIEAGIGQHVHFLGPVGQTALAGLYRRSHVLIHPTFYDPFSWVVVEALASGCAVVTTRRCGAAEIITEGVNGRLISRPDDDAAFASACCFFADPAVWRRAREAAITLGYSLSFDTHAHCVRDWLAG